MSVVNPGPTEFAVSMMSDPSRRSVRVPQLGHIDAPEDTLVSLVLRQSTKNAGPSSILSKNGTIRGFD